MGFSTASVAVQASTTNAAAGTTTSSSVDCGATAGRAGGLLTMKITNGGTGPALECLGYVEVSHDGTDWTRVPAPVVAGGTAANAVSGGTYRVQPGTRHLRTVFTGNTNQGVTVQAYLHRADIS